MDCSCLQTRRRLRSSLPPDWGMGHAQGEKDFSVRSTEWLWAGSGAAGVREERLQTLRPAASDFFGELDGPTNALLCFFFPSRRSQGGWASSSRPRGKSPIYNSPQAPTENCLIFLKQMQYYAFCVINECGLAHQPEESSMNEAPRVDYRTDPSQYRHWKLKFEGPVATLLADLDRKSVV